MMKTSNGTNVPLIPFLFLLFFTPYIFLRRKTPWHAKEFFIYIKIKLPQRFSSEEKAHSSCCGLFRLGGLYYPNGFPQKKKPATYVVGFFNTIRRGYPNGFPQKKKPVTYVVGFFNIIKNPTPTVFLRRDRRSESCNGDGPGVWSNRINAFPGLQTAGGGDLFALAA